MTKKIFLLAAAFMIHGSVYSQIIRVNNNPNVDADYADLQAAIDAASAGDTIYVEPSSISHGNIVIDKQLVLIGTGYFLNENDDTNADIRSSMVDNLDIGVSEDLDNLASGTVVIGLLVDTRITIYDLSTISRTFANFGIRFSTSDAAGTLIDQCYTKEITYSSTSISPSYTLKNSIIVGSRSDCTNATIENNTFVRPSGSTTLFLIADNSVIRSNIFAHLAVDDDINISGTGNAVSDNVTINYGEDLSIYFQVDGTTDGKWQLSETSPAIGAGYNGVDAGAFGGANPYVLSGLPPIPRISEATIPASGSSTSGLTIQVVIKSQN